MSTRLAASANPKEMANESSIDTGIETNIKTPNKAQSHKIQVVDRASLYRCSEDKSLLQGAELGMDGSIPVGCRGGGCGVCKVKILKGEYSAKRMSSAHISENDKQQGFVLACRVYPRSDMLIEVTALENPDN